MRVTVRYFASLRESLGVETEAIDLPEGIDTVAALRAWLGGRGGVWAEQFAADRPVRAAVAQRMAQPATPLSTDQEIAFFPPVTGG